MGKVIVTLNIMPESPDVDLGAVKEHAAKLVEGFGAQLAQDELEPVAFGLKALKLTLVFDEEKGSTDSLEAQIKDVEGVQSCEAVSVRRALG